MQASRAAEQAFAARLTILSETTTELSQAENIDDLCRRAVELGRERLGFDRLSIFFVNKDSATMLGTFGVDTEGRITDERSDSHPLPPDSNIWAVLRSQTPLLRITEAPLYLKGQEVGQGNHVYAGLWDGNTAIGFITVDNLLRMQPISDSDAKSSACMPLRLGISAHFSVPMQNCRPAGPPKRLLRCAWLFSRKPPPSFPKRMELMHFVAVPWNWAGNVSISTVSPSGFCQKIASACRAALVWIPKAILLTNAR